MCTYMIIVTQRKTDCLSLKLRRWTPRMSSPLSRTSSPVRYFELACEAILIQARPRHLPNCLQQVARAVCRPDQAVHRRQHCRRAKRGLSSQPRWKVLLVRSRFSFGRLAIRILVHSTYMISCVISPPSRLYGMPGARFLAQQL